MHGSLVVNFGGPGGSGVEPLPEFVGDLPRQIRRAFDVVGFDPRGVGASDPIRCRSPFARIFEADPGTDAGAAEIVAG